MKALFMILCIAVLVYNAYDFGVFVGKHGTPPKGKRDEP